MWCTAVQRAGEVSIKVRGQKSAFSFPENTLDTVEENTFIHGHNKKINKITMNLLNKS